MSTIQHADARKVLRLIEEAVANNRAPLKYRGVAGALGRNHMTDSRAVAQICDLLDAAAALAGIPLLALTNVRDLSDKINKKAWTANDVELQYRDAIISSSQSRIFTASDFRAIEAALNELTGMGNKKAWQYVRATVPDDVLFQCLTQLPVANDFDAIDDIGTDTPDRAIMTGFAYARNPQIRAAVMKRANGRCEFCGSIGFRRADGSVYLECHHIIALAGEGADRMTNVIAICANDHREAHFGERREDIEKQMIEIVKRLEPKIDSKEPIDLSI